MQLCCLAFLRMVHNHGKKNNLKEKCKLVSLLLFVFEIENWNKYPQLENFNNSGSELQMNYILLFFYVKAPQE